MANRVVVGSQWGDEGKAKIVDFLTEYADLVIRFQGGANAGHTVIVDGKKFIFHLIPAGIMSPGKTCVIGNGVVFEPAQFITELEEMRNQGIYYEGRIFISKRASVVMPYHKFMDQLRETRRGAGKIGTTGRGIGPAYADKAARTGIRIGDLLSPVDLKDKIEASLDEKNELLVKVYNEKPFDAAALTEEFLRFGETLRPYAIDSSTFINKAIKDGKRLLFEGAQGTVLDIDHGTYPFVTSSNTIAAAACTGSGIGPTKIDEVIGVSKAYTTRVGNGPFPTEFDPELGERIRKIGGEFGATTGRPRRCGWFDAVILRKAAMLNGLDSMAITKLDVLDTLEQIKICTAYKIDGKVTDEFPDSIAELERVEPIYEIVDGWKEDTTQIKDLDRLPAKARDYLKRLSNLVGCSISIVSVGPDRHQTMLTKKF